MVFIDCETSGLDHNLHEILEFGAINADHQTLSIKIKPLHIESAQPKALEINGYREEDWKDAVDQQVACGMILDFLDDAVVAGHNVGFDINFLNAMIRKYQSKRRIDYHVIDTVTVCYEHLVPLGLAKLSLKNVCSFVGIDPEPDVHRALNGATKAQKIYQTVTKAGWWTKRKWRKKAGL